MKTDWVCSHCGEAREKYLIHHCALCWIDCTRTPAEFCPVNMEEDLPDDD